MEQPARSPFGIPLYRAVWAASLFSNFGGLIQAVGASWMMTTLGASAQMIALVQTSTALPIVLLSLWAGAVADNLDRRRVMLAAQGLMLVVSTLLAVAAWSGMVTPWLLLGFTFLIGCGTAINGPAWQASVGDMVPRPLLPAAVAYNSMGFNVARSLGPAIGGAIVAAAGAAAAFGLNALSYLGLIGVLWRWQPELPPRVLPRERLGVAMEAGLRYVWLSPHLRAVLLRAALFGLGAGAVPALMPLVARDLVGGGALAYGVLLGGFGIGAVGGAILGARLRGRWSTERTVEVAAAALAAGTLAVALLPSLILAVPALALAGAGWVLALSTFNVSIQLGAPRWVVARAIALYQVAAFGGMATSSWLFGSIADGRGVVTALAVASGVTLLSLVAGRLLPLPAIGAIDLAPRTGWQPPETAVPVEPRSGPIVLTIEHRIAEPDVPTFLSLMAERRRIRRRDGARRWELLRDLGEATLWIERFHFATWLDYQRFNARRTLADEANLDSLARLWIDGMPPVVHRRIERQTGSLPSPRDVDTRVLDPITDPTRSS